MQGVMHQLLGLSVCVVCVAVFLVRYGIPKAGTALGYITFGGCFLLFGVLTGSTLETDISGLLLLERWNINLSFISIGYAAMASGLVGLAVALRDIFRGVPPAPGTEDDSQ